MNDSRPKGRQYQSVPVSLTTEESRALEGLRRLSQSHFDFTSAGPVRMRDRGVGTNWSGTPDESEGPRGVGSNKRGRWRNGSGGRGNRVPSETPEGVLKRICSGRPTPERVRGINFVIWRRTLTIGRGDVTTKDQPYEIFTLKHIIKINKQITDKEPKTSIPGTPVRTRK